MSQAAALKKSTALNTGVMEKAEAGRARLNTQSKVQDQIASNPFHQAMFTPGQDPQARKAVVAKLLTTTGDRTQDRANVQAFEDFREWLAAQSTELAQQIIALTNVNTMSELQSVIKDMNTDLLEFEDRMDPLMKIIDAIYQLRSQGGPDTITDAFAEIEKDNEDRERVQREIQAMEEQQRSLNDDISRLRDQNITLGAKKTLFGFGTTPASAREEIARNEQKIADAQADIEKSRLAVEEKRNQKSESKLGDLAPYKEQLANLLNMTSEENRDKLIALRDAASSFITTSQERTGSLRDQFLDMRQQIGRVEDNNSGMTRTYAVLVEAMSDAEKNNLGIRANLSNAPENEDTIAETVRKEKLMNLDDHVMVLKRSQADTIATHGELAQQRVRVNTMKSNADDQIETARKLNTQGVAATADRLSMVLTAVSGAALNESAAVANLTLDRMRRSTNAITETEVVKAAMGLSKINTQLLSVMDELSSIKEVQNHATDIARGAIQDMQANMERLREEADAVRREADERAAVASGLAPDAQKGAAPAAANVFDNL